MSTKYTDKIKTWRHADTDNVQRINTQPKDPNITEEEVADWVLQHFTDMVWCERIHNVIHQQNCGQCLSCYCITTCDRVNAANYNARIQRNATGRFEPIEEDD